MCNLFASHLCTYLTDIAYAFGSATSMPVLYICLRLPNHSAPSISVREFKTTKVAGKSIELCWTNAESTSTCPIDGYALQQQTILDASKSNIDVSLIIHRYFIFIAVSCHEIKRKIQYNFQNPLKTVCPGQ